MDSNQFAESIKAKYPQYSSWDNAKLTQAMLKKYPTYAGKVDMTLAESLPSTGIAQKPRDATVGYEAPELNMSVAPRDLSASRLPPQGAEAPSGVISKFKDTVKRGADTAANAAIGGIKRGVEGVEQVIGAESLSDVAIGAQKTVQGVAEGAMSLAASPVLFAIGAAGPEAMGHVVDFGKNMVDQFPDTPLPGSGMSPRQMWESLPEEAKAKVGETFYQMKAKAAQNLKENPQAADLMVQGYRTILDMVGMQAITKPTVGAPKSALQAMNQPLGQMGKDMAQTLGQPALEASKAVGTAFKDVIGKPIGQAVSAVGKGIDRAAVAKGNDMIFRGIKPTITKGRQLDKVKETYQTANKAIVDAGEKPVDLKTYSESIKNAKRKLWDNIQSRLDADGNRSKVSMRSISERVYAIADDPNLNRINPNAAKQVREFGDALVSLGDDVTVLDAEDMKQLINAEMEGLFGEMNLAKPLKEAKKLVTSMIGQQLDDILSTPGTGDFQKMKNTYGSLMAISDDVNKRLVVFERQNPEGIFTGLGKMSGAGDIAKGLLTKDPTEIAKGLSKMAVGKYIKMQNDANELVRQGFENLSKKPIGQALSEASKSGQAMMPTSVLWSQQESIPQVRARMAAEGMSKAQIDAKVREMLPYDGTQAREGLSTADLQGTKGMAGLRGPKVGKTTADLTAKTKAPKQSLEAITESAGGWSPGAREVFDNALLRGNAEKVRLLLPTVPLEYRNRFSNEIGRLISSNPKKAEPAAQKRELAFITPEAKAIRERLEMSKKLFRKYLDSKSMIA